MDLTIIQNKIYEIRGERVMLDKDLAEMYATETRQLKRAVRRNIKRFPSDFMFELTKEEANVLLNNRVSQIGTPLYNFSSHTPFAFTEQGVVMLASVLRSDIAIDVNISIMRAFVAMRKYIATAVISNPELIELKERIKLLEQGADQTLGAVNDLSEDMRKELDDIYMALAELSQKNLLTAENKERAKIGFKK